MAGHALLSPSGASKWLACTPSARAEEGLSSSSSYAEEGTLAHALGELLIRKRLGDILTKPYKTALKKIQDNEMYSADIQEHCEEYATFVLEAFNEAKVVSPDAKIYLEQRLDLTPWIPECFGTGDVVIVADGVLTLIDLKYGKGVPVFAEGNKQMYLYGLGALNDLDHLFGIKQLNLVIYQPRINNVNAAPPLAKVDLLEWARIVLVPAAKLAWEGAGEFVPGDHCRFCKIKPTCAANKQFNLAAALAEFDEVETQYTVPPSTNMVTPEEISTLLQSADRIKNWLASVEEYALKEALAGTQWPGMKLVEGRSNRKITNEEGAAEVLMLNNLDRGDVYVEKMKGITDLTKLLGTADFNRLLSPFITKPPGKPVLVVEADKRAPYSSAGKALDDFKDDI